jgi:ribonuclease HI
VRRTAEEQRRARIAQRKAALEVRRQAREAVKAPITPKQKLRRDEKAQRKVLAEEAYQLLPTIANTIRQQAVNNTQRHKYNHVFMDPASQDNIEIVRKELSTGVRHIYSDGSLVRMGKPQCGMAFAVVGEEQPVVQGTTKGFASSVKAEMMGLIAGIIATPPEQDVCIRLDNQAVVKQFKEIVVHRKRASVRAKLRCDYAVEWAVIARLCGERQGSIKVEWIKGHDGNKWNEKADVEAKEAQTQRGEAWQVDMAAQDDIRYAVTMAGVTLERDTRHVLKMQTTRRWHQEWRALKRTKKSVKDYKGTDWLGTLSIIHSNKPVNTFFSSQQDTRLRSHRVKKVHGMLPTMDALHARRPDLYPNDICRQCEEETEDNEHIWTCRVSRPAQSGIWTEALGLLSGWGEISARHYNKEREKKRKLGEKPPQEIVWLRPRTRDCREALIRVVNGTGLREEEEEAQEHTARDDRWMAYHLYRGLVPKALTKEWGKVFKNMPESVVQHTCRLFCRFVEREARETLWKPRCEATVEWEKENGITQRQKEKTPTERRRGVWKQIYGRTQRENECLCGRDMEEHEAGRCPGEQSDTRVADQAVIDTLLGLRHMDIMERRGNMTTKEFEVDDT